MASPLATMATVIRDKSTAAMPFATSLVRRDPAYSPANRAGNFLQRQRLGRVRLPGGRRPDHLGAQRAGPGRRLRAAVPLCALRHLQG